MLEAVSKLIESLTAFSKRRLSVILIILVIFLILYPYIYQNFIHIRQIEKKIEVLKKITEIEINQFTDKKIKDYYRKLLDNLEVDLVQPVISKKSIAHSRSTNIIKLLTGSLVFLVLAVTTPFATFDAPHKKPLAIVVFLIISASLGFVGLMLPTFRIKIVNYIGFPLIQLLLLISLLYKKER